MGEPVVGARLLLLGQAPGPREADRSRMFAHTAGGRLFAWMARLGVDEATFRERVWMSAAARCFPGRAPAGGDRVPSPVEVATCSRWLERELELLRPATVMTLGTLACETFLPPAPLAARVGQRFAVERWGVSFELVPLPHPSGRSTWTNRPEHQRLLERALDLFASSAGWRARFERPDALTAHEPDSPPVILRACEEIGERAVLIRHPERRVAAGPPESKDLAAAANLGRRVVEILRLRSACGRPSLRMTEWRPGPISSQALRMTARKGGDRRRARRRSSRSPLELTTLMLRFSVSDAGRKPALFDEVLYSK